MGMMVTKQLRYDDVAAFAIDIVATPGFVDPGSKIFNHHHIASVHHRTVATAHDPVETLKSFHLYLLPALAAVQVASAVDFISGTVPKDAWLKVHEWQASLLRPARI
jgi:hypothetical protein